MKRVFLCSALLLLAVMAGCSARPYVICRGEAYCTGPLTHDEAMHAAQIKKAWGDDALYVRPGR
jgi:hypothetical protein